MKRMKSQHPNPLRGRIRFTARATHPLGRRISKWARVKRPSAAPGGVRAKAYVS
jgi:hypothetical protein